MLELANASPWAAGLFPGWDAQRREVVVVAVKVRFRFGADGTLEPDAPPSLVAADRHHGEPASSSLAQAAEGVPFKQGAECLIHGTVHPAAAGQRARGVRVALEAPGGGWCKQLRVTGRRRWQRTALGLVPGEAEPLQPTRLRYEYAFGGVDVRCRALEVRNPVGMGFAASRRGAAGAELPRIEYQDEPVSRWGQRPRPAGLGPVAVDWQPRRGLMAACDDEAAAAGLCPYREPVPADLFNAAPADQRLPGPFAGGERLSLEGIGCWGGAAVLLSLPAFAPRLRLTSGSGGPRDFQAACDTAQVDADAGTLDMVARACLPWNRLSAETGWVLVRPPGAVS